MRTSLSSLRTRLLLLVVAAYLPAVAMTVVSIQRDRQEAFDAVRTRLLRLLEDAHRDNDAAIAFGRQTIVTWAEVPDVATGGRAACEAALARLLRYAPQVASPTRIGVDGRINCGGRTPASIGSDVSGNPMFQQVLAADSTVLGPYIPGDSTRDALVPLNIALRDRDGKKAGVLSIGLRLNWLARLQRNAELPEGSIITVGDSSGLLLARVPYLPIVGTTLPGLNRRFVIDRANGNAESGVAIRNTTEGVERLIAHRHLTSAQGTFVRVSIGMPPDIAYAAPTERSRTRVALLIITALIALAIAWFGAEVFVLRDVDAILAATTKLGAGDLSARTGIHDRRGELGQLAESFDTMASQLEHRQDRMRHAERMESLGRLAGGVAHDFNNLLTAIVGSADLALDSLPTDHPAHADLATIKASASRSGSLIRQLLDFSRRTPLTTAPQRIDVLVQQAASLLGRVVPANVALTVHVTSRRLARVDSGRIEQAIMNLAVNARDAMPDGGTLSISLDDVDVAADAAGGMPPEGAWIRLRVTDTGHGMSADVLRRVFEPFFTTKAPGDGTGLGLSMVYGTVQHHGGCIHIDSAVGVGTTVTIWLPESVSAPAHTADDSPAVLGPNAATRILVAEDQPEVRTLMHRVLTRAGYDVVLAEDGTAALALASSMFDELGVVVTDYDMPGVRGDVFAQRLRERDPDLPLVLTSGFTSEGWPAALLDTPHTAVLEKPFSAHSLLQAIELARRGQPVG